MPLRQFSVHFQLPLLKESLVSWSFTHGITCDIVYPFQDSSWLSWVFEKVVMAMVIYFIISIIHSMAQSYHKRVTQQSRLLAKESKD